ARDITERKRAEAELRESEERYRVLFETSPDGILVAEIETHQFKYANPAICRMLNYSKTALTGMHVADIHPKDELQTVMDDFMAIARGEKTLVTDLPCKRKDGTIFYADVTAKPAAFGSSLCNVGFFRDITERKNIRELLLASQRQHQMLLSENPDGMLVVERNGNILFANPAAASLFNLDIERLIGSSFDLPDLREKGSERTLASGIHTEMDFVEIHWKGSPAILVSVRDITAHKVTKDQLSHMAHRDPLTQLANRRLLGERLEHTINNNRRTGGIFSVLMLDLDRFKQVNDTMGHNAGDLLLKETAGRILDTVRESDTVARIGGDEFVIIADPLKATSDAGVLASKILAKMEAPFLFGGKKFNITTSIGITIFPMDGKTAGDLLKNADSAMFIGKERGRNRYQYYNQSIHQSTMHK
ncbi:MAG: diguanylate cyclase, partial [Myxococcota bacterium]